MIEKITNEYGVWEVADGCIWMLISPSQKWLDENPPPEPEPTPTPEPTVWDELAAAYTEGVNSIDK